MSTRKASKAKKGSKRAKRRGSGKASRNWSRIRQRWYQSTLSLEAFLRASKIPLATGKRHLSVADKNKFLDQSTAAAQKFRERLAKLVAKDDSRLYISSLKHVSVAVQEVLLDSAEAFKSSPISMGQEKAGRLVLAAGEMLLEVTSDLQGIPEDEDGEGWPLSRAFSPFSYQRDFIHDTPSSIRLEEKLPADGSKDPFVFAFIGGLGSGKTYCGAQKAGQIAFLNRGHMGMVAAPTYRMLADSTKPTFLKILDEKGLSYQSLKTENAVRIFGDTKVLFRSMDIPEHLKGPNLAWAWIDEGAQMPNREGYDVINGRIRGDDKPVKCLIFTSTPDGLNWVHDVVVEEAVQNRVRLYRARTQDNPTLGDYYQRLSASFDPRYAAQELEAEFLNIFSGQAYWNFSPVESVFSSKSLSIDPGLPLDLMCDFNVSPMCWNVGQDFLQNGDIYSYIFDELHLDTAGTDIAVAEFLERYGNHRAGVRVWGDATAMARHTSATRSDYDIIEKAIEKAKIPVAINIGRSNPRVSERVLSVNARLMSSKGIRKLFIAKQCRMTKIDFERTAFIPGTRQLDKRGRAVISKRVKKSDLTHHTDAIGYKIFRQWPVRAPSVAQLGAN